MIYILTVSQDATSCSIIKWLKYFSYTDYLRINADDMQELKNLKIFLNVDGNRSGIVYTRTTGRFNIPPDDNINMSAALSREFYNGVLRPIELKAKRNLVPFENAKNINKFHLILLAKEYGLAVPQTIISNKKKEIINYFISKGIEKIIIKPSDEIFAFSDGKSIFKQFTTELTIREIANIPESFAPTTFQERIKKKYDVKIVSIGDCFFAFALINTNSQYYHVDIRKIRNDVRIAQIEIPNALNSKIRRLTKKLKFDICTLDFILNADDEFVFLEVNPYGQFGDLSKASNIFLEKKIAEYLIKLNEGE